jgi:GNAT superfamily N-acetyltransferase
MNRLITCRLVSITAIFVFHALNQPCWGFVPSRRFGTSTTTELAMFFAEEVKTNEQPSSVKIVLCEGDEASIQLMSDLMIDAFWLNSPQKHVVDDVQAPVSDAIRSKLVNVQHSDLMEKYGERLGKRVLTSSLFLAFDQESNDVLGGVCIDVCLLDTMTEQIIPVERSETMLKNAVASLGPKQRREYKDSSVQQIATALLPPNVQAVCCLSNLVVGPNARRKGVAKKLCSEVERVASAEWGYRELLLKVEADNDAARTLYENKMGYSVKYVNPESLSLRVNAAVGSFVEVPSDTFILSKAI